jgi:DNA-binding Lrp family transcriptional regulator
MLTRKDILVFACLRENARETLTELSKRTKITISSLYEMIRKAEGFFIKKYTAMLNFSELGFPILAEILIKVEHDDREGVRDFLQKSFNINKVLKINNHYDFFIEGYFKSIIDVDHFLGRLEREFRVMDRKVFYVCDEISNEKFMSDSNLIDLVL